MAMALRCAIVFISVSSLVNLSVIAQESSKVEERFLSSEVEPDVVPIAPSSLVYVKYSSGAIVDLGNDLAVTDVVTEPSSVSWDADPSHLYTLAMVDPDVPSRKLPLGREFRHWLVVNILGDQVDAGETISSYVSPTPPPGSGPHRYVFLVYQQQSKLDSENLKSFNRLPTNFNITEFADQNNLGNPIAGNFFQAQVLGEIL